MLSRSESTILLRVLLRLNLTSEIAFFETRLCPEARRLRNTMELVPDLVAIFPVLRLWWLVTELNSLNMSVTGVIFPDWPFLLWYFLLPEWVLYFAEVFLFRFEFEFESGFFWKLTEDLFFLMLTSFQSTSLSKIFELWHLGFRGCVCWTLFERSFSVLLFLIFGFVSL